MSNSAASWTPSRDGDRDEDATQDETKATRGSERNSPTASIRLVACVTLMAAGAMPILASLGTGPDKDEELALRT